VKTLLFLLSIICKFAKELIVFCLASRSLSSSPASSSIAWVALFCSELTLLNVPALLVLFRPHFPEWVAWIFAFAVFTSFSGFESDFYLAVNLVMIVSDLESLLILFDCQEGL
jgi:hypothetical protein